MTSRRNITTAERTQEARVRRRAERQGFLLRRSRRRDPQAIDYGLYTLHLQEGRDQPSGMPDWTDLDGIERFLDEQDDAQRFRDEQDAQQLSGGRLEPSTSRRGGVNLSEAMARRKQIRDELAEESVGGTADAALGGAAAAWVSKLTEMNAGIVASSGYLSALEGLRVASGLGQVSGIVEALNNQNRWMDVVPKINYPMPKINYPMPKLNYPMPKLDYAIPTLDYALPKLVDLKPIAKVMRNTSFVADIIKSTGINQLAEQIAITQKSMGIAAVMNLRPGLLDGFARLETDQIREVLRNFTLMDVPSPTTQELDRVGQLVDNGDADEALDVVIDEVVIDDAWFATLVERLRAARPAWSDEKAHRVSLYIVYATIVVAAMLSNGWGALGVTVAQPLAADLTDMTKPLRRDGDDEG